jgi:hypothetical protein
MRWNGRLLFSPDFANSTGDAVFDDTLKTALRISLGAIAVSEYPLLQRRCQDLEIDDPRRFQARQPNDPCPVTAGFQMKVEPSGLIVTVIAS